MTPVVSSSYSQLKENQFPCPISLEEPSPQISGYWIDLKCDSSDKFKESYDSMVYLALVVIVKRGGRTTLQFPASKAEATQHIPTIICSFSILIFSFCFLYHIILDIYIVWEYFFFSVLLFNKHALNFILLVHRSSIEVYYP